MSYYKNYWVFMNNPIAGSYLRWAYRTGLRNLSYIDYYPNFKKENFSCLLCGVGNERTAREYINFVLNRNFRANIYIIDINEDHLLSIRKLAQKEFPSSKITILRINALDLVDIIDENSIDWIETDCFFEFFDNESMKKLLTVWHKILKSDGFITTRDYISDDKNSFLINHIRKIIMEKWLNVKIFNHTRYDYELLLNNYFKSAICSTRVPTYKTFSMIKK